MPMFRFTIRDLLWLMVVVGMAVGWWLDKQHWADSKKVAVNDARNLLQVIADPFADPLSEQHHERLLKTYFPAEDVSNWKGRGLK